MRAKLVALAAALLMIGGVFTVAMVEAPVASANPTIVWQLNYGSSFTSNSPNVWSNRVPLWSVGSDPNLTFQLNGEMVDHMSTCNLDVCWVANSPYNGPSPYEAYWDSRGGANDGHWRIYSSEGAIRWDNNVGGWAANKMVFWANGCITQYVADYAGQGWQIGGFPIWQNSNNPACDIQI